MWSVSGSRANGQGELLDGTNIQNYQDRGSGSGVLGTTLGVDSIAEFQLLTNTYGAQYGGNGSVVNAVTRSGTNDFHGSAYEFLRNSALDARNFPDPAAAIQEKPIWRHRWAVRSRKTRCSFSSITKGSARTGETNRNRSRFLHAAGPAPARPGAPATWLPSRSPQTNGSYFNCGAGKRKRQQVRDHPALPESLLSVVPRQFADA